MEMRILNKLSSIEKNHQSVHHMVRVNTIFGKVFVHWVTKIGDTFLMVGHKVRNPFSNPVNFLKEHEPVKRKQVLLPLAIIIHRLMAERGVFRRKERNGYGSQNSRQGLVQACERK